MCSPLDPLSCPDAISHGITQPVAQLVGGLVGGNLDTILTALTTQLHTAVKAVALLLAEWILIPSTTVCPTTGPDWVSTCAAGTSPAAQLRGWLLPITATVALAGILWQAITMVITRKGEPLLHVVKGLFATAVWGAVGIAGTQLALRAGDAYAYWVLQQAIFGDSLNPTQDLGTALAGMSAADSYSALLLVVVLQVPFLLAAVAQIILMIFREGAVIVLAGQLQLAAAGGFTRLTSPWLAKVTGWMAALIAYKPIAASIYAVAFALMGGGIRNLIMGLTVMLLTLVALPALMRFFNWSVGAIGSHSNGIGLFGTSIAAGLHAASALHTGGGHSATEHARWLASNGPTGAAPPPTSGSALTAAASSTGVGAGVAAGAATGGVGPVIGAVLQTGGDQVRHVADRITDTMGEPT